MDELEAELFRRNEVRFTLLEFATEVGVIRDVRDHVQWLSENVHHDDHKVRLAQRAQYLQKMEAFEAIHGPGSCIDLRHGFVIRLVNSSTQYFTSNALKNADAVNPTLREKFLASA